ncbi:MAG: PEP/pyruvate-binding domain-containing protein [Pseudomonadota bacterium]
MVAHVDMLDDDSLRSLDTRFSTYHDLMAAKVLDILLVANPYDAYILEEDGSLAAKIISEYSGLNLSRPPRVTHTTGGAETLASLEKKHFDLVIVMPNLIGMTPHALGAAIKAHDRRTPVVLLCHGEHVPAVALEEAAGVDQTLVWSGDSDLLLALVKNAEDRLNVEADTRRAGVRVLILVEDAPLYRSFFLPLIYKEVVRQTQAVLSDSLNDEHRLLKMRARPKILVADTYEQAMAIYQKFKPYVFGIMSDTRFPHCGRVAADAGIHLLRAVKTDIAHMPMLLMSSEPENRAAADALNVRFVDKNSPRLAEEIRGFFLDYLGFGDFVFRSADGVEIGRAASFSELEALLPRIPDEPIFYHACRNRFSNWFMARSEIALASFMSRLTVEDFDDVAALRRFLIRSIRVLRKNRQKGVVAQFNPRTYDADVVDFVKIGGGSLGGKARGLAFFSNLLQKEPSINRRFPSIDIRVPQTLVLTTETFETFIEQNGLAVCDADGMDDAAISRRFLAADLPGGLLGQLAAFVEKTTCPVAVRSSSLSEDAYHHPYTGFFKTFMLPNNNPSPEIRLAQMSAAIKGVFASAFFVSPRTFTDSTALMARRDSMAVMIQALAGRAIGDYFYPALSGTVRSWNYYPVGPMRPEDGVVRMTFGMGAGLEDARLVLRFCPRHPAVLPQFSTVEDILTHSQTRFYALRLTDGNAVVAPEIAVVAREVDAAAGEFPLRALTSTYMPEEHRLRDTVLAGGVPIVTFAAVLKYGRPPLCDLLCELIELGRKGMGCDVEFEFSLDLTPETDRPDIFHLLQMRPLAATATHADVHVDAADRATACWFANQCLGNGVIGDVADIVTVRRDRFDPSQTPAMAEAIGRLNTQLKAEGRPFLVAGPGRWGSADRWLGIPVRWRDIDGARVMIEIRGAQITADASNGSHFFQQLTSQGVFYLTVTEGGDDVIDWDWLEGQPIASETPFVNLIRLPAPLMIKADGRHGQGVVIPPR